MKSPTWTAEQIVKWVDDQHDNFRTPTQEVMRSLALEIIDLKKKP